MINILSEKKPTLSVVIAVFNGSYFLKKSLAAITESADDYTEIILVNDASTDNSAEVGKQFGIKIIELEKQAGPGNARNIGVEAAIGEIIFFVDADVLIKSETIAEIRSIFAENPEYSAIFGSYDNSPDERNFFSQYRNLMHHFFHQTGKTEAETFWSGLGAIKRDVFLKTGGFKISTIEDIELGYRLKKSEHRILLVPQLQAKHLKKWTFGSILKTDFWGRAVPWSELLLLSPEIKPDLNVKASQKISIFLAGIFILSLIGLFWDWRIIFFSSLSLVIFVLLNLSFYKFFLQIRGLFFTLGILPMHLLYFLYSGAAYALSWFNVKILKRTIVVK